MYGSGFRVQGSVYTVLGFSKDLHFEPLSKWVKDVCLVVRAPEKRKMGQTCSKVDRNTFDFGKLALTIRTSKTMHAYTSYKPYSTNYIQAAGTPLAAQAIIQPSFKISSSHPLPLKSMSQPPLILNTPIVWPSIIDWEYLNVRGCGT